MSDLNKNKYILLTAAKNEAVYIEATIKSILTQEIPPKKWIIIDDNSDDNTAEIISKYVSEHPFIQLVKLLNSGNRNFASKVFAINAGLKELKNLEYNFIGILDADITMESDYYKNVLQKFAANSNLGIAGGICYDFINNQKHEVYNESNSVRGGIQLFRRACFEEVGGFLPMPFGGEDAVAQITARMLGWEVETFNDISVLHHRKTGTGGQNLLSARFREGQMEYSMGYLPLYQTFKCLRRIKSSPLIIGSLARLTGFWISYLGKQKRLVSSRFVNFFRQEQKEKIFSLSKYLRNK